MPAENRSAGPQGVGEGNVAFDIWPDGEQCVRRNADQSRRVGGCDGLPDGALHQCMHAQSAPVSSMTARLSWCNTCRAS